MELFRSELGSITASGVSAPDLTRGRAMLDGAAELFAQLGAPSPLGTVLFSVCAARVGITEGDRGWGAAAGVSLLGYACRMAEREGASRSAVSEAIQSELVFGPGGDIDYDAFCDDRTRMASLVDRVLALTHDSDGVTAIGDVTPNTWCAFSTAATSRLRKSFIRHGVPRQALPQEETCNSLLRLGYVLRLVDEVAGERPAGKIDETVDLLDGDSMRPAVDHSTLEVSFWLSNTVARCVHDFAPGIERLLEAGTLAVLGRSSFDELPGDSDVMTVADARFGYALRHEECRLVAGARGLRPGDALMGAIEALGRAGQPEAADLVRLLGEIVRYGSYGGAEALLSSMPGAASGARSVALAAGLDRRSADERYAGMDAALGLMHYGYLLHRAAELRSLRLGDETSGRGGRGGGLGSD